MSIRSKVNAALIVFGGLIATTPFAPVRAQSHGDVSIPEPTSLQSAVLAEGSRLLSSNLIGKLESGNAGAEISVISIEVPDGKQVSGVRIALKSADADDDIYITDTQLAVVKDELEFLEFSRQFDDQCRAKSTCIHGIARCRPSQTERQAYCPGRYTTRTSEGGLSLGTPRHVFKFPSVQSSQLGTMVSKAMQVLVPDQE